MSGLDKGFTERKNVPDKNRPLPPEIERVRQKMGIDVLGMWADIYKAAGAEESTVPAYQRFIREGYVPAAVRIFCEQYEKKEQGAELRRRYKEALASARNERPLPRSFIMGKAAIIPPDAPDEKKNRS